MNNSLLLGAGRGPRLEILKRIKRSVTGLSVKELSAELGMSYMGVKAHCMALATEGCLATFRKPTSTSMGSSRGTSREFSRGRPSMIYRISPAGERLFQGPETDFPSLLLKEAISLYGPTAAQKILVMAFRSMARRYAGLVGTGSAVEKASLLAKTRDREGRMSELVQGDSWEIRECSQSIVSLTADFPEIPSLEEHMVSEVLGVAMQRVEIEGVVCFRPR